MKERCFAFLTLAALGAPLAAIPALGNDPAEFRWRTDLEKARKDAQSSGKPLLVVFR